MLLRVGWFGRRALVFGRRALVLGLVLTGLALFPLIGLGVMKPEFKPGYNFYSLQDDVELGKEYSEHLDKQLPLLHDPQVQKFLEAVAKRLVGFAPNNYPEYVWQFRVVNSSQINAFALPGGYIYVNRGVFEAAEDEAQLAGVIAHESGHVVMRHGTHIASQALLAQGGVAILTGILGRSSSLTSQLAQLGLGLGVDSLLLKNSRTLESQADEVGTYILYQAGYDPHAMVKFFQIIAKKYPQRTLEFFSDHPSPENRIRDVDAEIAQLGPPRGLKTDSPQFEGIKRYVAEAIPEPPKRGTPSIDARKEPPPPPSSNLVPYDGKMFTLDYPDNWQAERNEDGVAIYPPGGMVTGSEGDTAQAYGASVSLYAPQQASWGLVDATQELIDTMRQSNPQLHVLQQTGMNLRGNPAVSTLLQNDSPLEGQRETDHLVTVRRGDSVLTFIFIAPAGSFDVYAPTFDKMLQSIDLARGR